MLLDGVRQGQPLGALLGYLFERRLHELRLDAQIDDFRRLAPLAPVNADAASRSRPNRSPRATSSTACSLREVHQRVIVRGEMATPEVRSPPHPLRARSPCWTTRWTR